MRKKDIPLEVVEVHDYGHIGAGIVVPFAPRKELRSVVIPKDLAKPSEVGTMTISGESLTGDGIHDGDLLVFRMNHTTRQITPESVCVVKIEATGELAAKHVVRNVDGPKRVALRSSHPNYPDRMYDESDVEILGLAFAVQHMSDKFGRFNPKPEIQLVPDRRKVAAAIKANEKPPFEEPF